jgi:hypothetical protein
MSQELVLHLPPALWQALAQQAETRQQDVATLATEFLAQAALPSAPMMSYTPAEEAMLREQVAYEQLHPRLRQLYPEQFVAVWQGELVDRDVDVVALLGRVRTAYPNEPVLIRQVTTEPDPVLEVRSPRLLAQ